jgi:hypothetical protein
MNPRTWARATSLCLALLASAHPAISQNAPEKIFRYAFPVAETGFDPAQISDL